MKRLVALVGVPVLTVALAGCSSDNKSGGDQGQVSNRQQHQHTNPDGTQTQTRSQVREQDGQRMKETETRTRQPMDQGGTQQTTPR